MWTFDEPAARGVIFPMVQPVGSPSASLLLHGCKVLHYSHFFFIFLQPPVYGSYMFQTWKPKFFCRNKIQIHFPSAKIVLIIWLKIPQMPQKISAQFVCSSPKVFWIFEKNLSQFKIVLYCDMYYIKRNLVVCYQIINKFYVTRLFCFIGQPCIQHCTATLIWIGMFNILNRPI